jgi:hypothetical protein
MEKKETYSILLRRPWLKQAGTTHDWGNNTLIITFGNKEITFSTIKKIKLNPSQQPRHLDDEYDWDGIIDQDEK